MELARKLVPLTVSVKPDPPAMAEVGLLPVVVGTGLLIVKVKALEMPPPGAGLDTVTDAVPAAAISIARIAAVTRVVET